MLKYFIYINRICIFKVLFHSCPQSVLKFDTILAKIRLSDKGFKDIMILTITSLVYIYFNWCSMWSNVTNVFARSQLDIIDFFIGKFCPSILRLLELQNWHSMSDVQQEAVIPSVPPILTPLWHFCVLKQSITNGFRFWSYLEQQCRIVSVENESSSVVTNPAGSDVIGTWISCISS